MHRFKEAEKDCTKAIFVDSTYSKAFARRATARVALGKLQAAKQGAAQITSLVLKHFRPYICFDFFPSQVVQHFTMMTK